VIPRTCRWTIEVICRPSVIGFSFALLALAGCGIIPSDGPSGRAVVQAGGAARAAPYLLVKLDYRVAEAASSAPRKVTLSLADASSEARDDIIREGDTLVVSIYEASGAAVFSSGGADAPLTGSSTHQDLPTTPRVVDADGCVTLPFAGRIRVAGLTPDAAGAAIRGVVRGQFDNPQVLVDVTSSSANSVSVLGDVRNVNRFRLTPHNDRLLDVIAEAGGPTLPYQDILIEIVRGSESVKAPMTEVMDDPAENIRLAPHDQVRLLPNERKYSVFGAFGHVTQTPITDPHLSLAGAISRAGGLDTWTADDTSVFVFRFERPEVIAALGLSGAMTPRGVPVVYQLDFQKNPGGLLVADNFDVRSDDLIYVPRAGLVTLNKFMQAVNAVAQANYAFSVTGVP
jgi:polysaccharide export outer membrane protein